VGVAINDEQRGIWKEAMYKFLKGLSAFSWRNRLKPRARLEVFMAMKIRVPIFWIVTSVSCRVTTPKTSICLKPDKIFVSKTGFQPTVNRFFQNSHMRSFLAKLSKAARR
jgi:hypothetical protein